MLDEIATLKRAAAVRAVDYIQDGMKVGLGTGSTAEFAVRELAQRVAHGLQITSVPTSEKIGDMARRLGMAPTTLEECPRLDVTIDGADEVDLTTFNVIKGRGGALLREKIVALATGREILIVDETKVVKRLGEHAPVPVEVVQFGWTITQSRLTELGCIPQRRIAEGGQAYTTDAGNYILDCQFSGIDDPAAMATAIKQITGVVEHGLFVDIARVVVEAHPQGTQVFSRES
ncbi:MAG: ribose-5-phosphate isomerase RpiA [Chloroflexota bacterium]|nr:ribose-5-phosphate isomerase RpiA [Chloroflexota bacterium]